MTTTDRDVRRVLVDLSVIAVSAIVLAASYVAVAQVERQRRPLPKAVAAANRQVSSAPPTAQVVSSAPLITASPAPVLIQPAQPPVLGVRAAPERRVRRVVVRRRSRAS